MSFRIITKQQQQHEKHLVSILCNKDSVLQHLLHQKKNYEASIGPGRGYRIWRSLKEHESYEVSIGLVPVFFVLVQEVHVYIRTKTKNILSWILIFYVPSFELSGKSNKLYLELIYKFESVWRTSPPVVLRFVKYNGCDAYVGAELWHSMDSGSQRVTPPRPAVMICEEDANHTPQNIVIVIHCA